jgi:hypothetical protein
MLKYKNVNWINQKWAIQQSPNIKLCEWKVGTLNLVCQLCSKTSVHMKFNLQYGILRLYRKSSL